MTNRKTTRRALFMSVISLMLCCAMLVGTTFAWFTDEVKSVNNVITAGNLDVELEYAKVVNGQLSGWNTVQGADKIFDPNALWEPGRVEVVYLKVSNLGTLALKYQLGVNVVDETPSVSVDGDPLSLSEHLVFKVVEMPDALTTYTDREAVEIAAGTELGLNTYNGKTTALDPKGSQNAEDYVALIVYMPETVGNEANYRGTVPTITLGVNLYATQKDAESDSFGPDYDEDAWDDALVVTSEADLMAALAERKPVKLGADITLAEGVTISEDAVINLNGHTMTATGERAYLFTVEGDADLTIVGGKLVAESTNGQKDGTGTSTGASSSVYFESTGTLTMTNVEVQGSVRGGHRAIEVYGGNAVLTNVDITTSYGSGVNSGAGANVTLNDCDITVNGMYSAPYNSVAFSVMGGGEMTINSGNYKMINDATYATGDTHGGWVGIVMSSGGTLNINGGMYTNVPAAGFNPQYERAIFELENNAPAVSTLNLLGGTFDPQEDQIYGGYGDQYYPTYNVPNLIDNGNGTWTAKPAGYEFVAEGLYKNGNTYYVESANGLKYFSAKALTGNNSTAETAVIELQTDIDLAGADFSSIIAQRGDTLTINGNGHTISNVNVISGANDNTTGQAGMFYCYPNSTLNVSNLILKDIVVTADESGNGYAAAVVGYCEGAAVLNNVDVVNATINGEKSSGMLAGHVGNGGSLTATGCDVSGTVTLFESSNEPAGHYAGKYVGTIADPVVLNNCTANVTVGGKLHANNVGDVYGRMTSAGSLTIDGTAQKAASTQDELNAAVASGNNVSITLAAGNYTMPEPDLRGKTLTITGTKDTVIDVSAVDANDQFVTGANVVFDGVTLNFGTVNYMGFANTKSLTYKNCTINGLQFLYGESVTFENCDLNSNGAEHCVWTYGAKNVSFTECDFTYGDRGINCYSDNDVAGGKQTVNFTNCTFTTENTASEGAVEINSCYFSIGIEVNLEGCTAPEYGELAYVSPWDSTNGAKTTINIK